MLLTEEEARTKWCPFVRFVQLHNDLSTAAFNRVSTSEGLETTPSVCRCIASECMAWRWAGIEEYRRANMGDTFHGDEPHIPMEQHPLSNRPYLQANHKGRFALTPRGFCGLAGKAE